MRVLRRHIRAVSSGSVPLLGTVTHGSGVLGWRVIEQTTRKASAPRIPSASDPQEVRVFVPGDVDPSAPDAELSLLEGRNVLVAIRNAESTAAVADWVKYHATEHGTDGALIFDRTEGGEAGFCDDLNTDIPVLVVTADRPMGQPDGPDLRQPEIAPAAPKRGTPSTSAWHSAFLQTGLYDLLRYRFLASARAVAFLDIADLLLPLEKGGTVFDRAMAAPGHSIALHGVETYPWRLRQGAPAPHSDHIACRRTERRRVISWAIAPHGEGALRGVWQPGAPAGLPKQDTSPAPFIRAIGVVYPGAPVNSLVRKAHLREQPGLVDLMKRAFGADPIRLPAPAFIPPRPASMRLTLVTAMKNEGPFILDWVAHNRTIGASNILVYTNDCEDGTDHLLSLLADAGVTHRGNPYRSTGQVPQYAAFRAAEAEAVVQDADWLMTLDVDEYLNIHAGDGTLDALLAALPEAHAISVPWRLFGNADRHHFEDAPVVDQFAYCAPEYAPRPLQAWAFKTVYRNAGLFRRLGVHRPKGVRKEVRDVLNWCAATGQNLPPVIWDKAWRMSKAHWGYTHATLNHYAVRSAESFLIKRQRGKVNRTGRDQGLAYWFRMNHNAEEDRSISRLAGRVAAEKTALLALPGVRAAHGRAVAWHKARIKGLRADAEYAQFYNQITAPRMQHLSRIATNFGANVHLAGPQVIPDDIAARDPSEPFYWTVKATMA